MVAACSRRNARESSSDINTNGEHASTNVSRALLNRSTVGFGLFGPVTFRRRERGKQREFCVCVCVSLSLFFSLRCSCFVSIGHMRGAIFEFPSLSRSSSPPSPLPADSLSLILSLFQAAPASLVLSYPSFLVHLFRTRFSRKMPVHRSNTRHLNFDFSNFLGNLLNFHSVDRWLQVTLSENFGEKQKLCGRNRHVLRAVEERGIPPPWHASSIQESKRFASMRQRFVTASR